MTMDKPVMDRKMAEIIKRVGFPSVLRSLLLLAQPDTPSERIDMINSLAKGLTLAISWEAYSRIHENDDYESAKSLIDDLAKEVHRAANANLNQVLQMMGKQSVPKTTNEQTYDSILKGMNNE